MDNYANTTLAFVNKLPNGDRDFTFYRNNTADTMLKKEEIQVLSISHVLGVITTKCYPYHQ